MSKAPVTVGILTFQSGQTLARALESVKDFDDIVVLDGGSTDETLDIAKQYGARIIMQDSRFKDASGRIINFAEIRNQHLAAARHQWFLFVDSDEYLSREAVDEIRTIAEAAAPPHDILAYWLPRKTVVHGTVIDCATVYPNYQMRFFHRSAAEGFIKPIHERIALKPGTKVGKLVHGEFVPLDMTREEMYAKQLRYLTLEVEKHRGDSFITWLRGPFYGALRSTASFLIRHIRVTLFCRGTKMPFWVEWMHYWYNWKLITMTGAKFFRPSKAPQP